MSPRASLLSKLHGPFHALYLLLFLIWPLPLLSWNQHSPNFLSRGIWVAVSEYVMGRQVKVHLGLQSALLLMVAMHCSGGLGYNTERAALTFCRQGQGLQGMPLGTNSPAGSPAFPIPNPAGSTNLNSLPSGNAASNAAASPANYGPSGQIGQVQQPKNLPTATSAVQSGSAGSSDGDLGTRPGTAQTPAAASQQPASISSGSSGAWPIPAEQWW